MAVRFRADKPIPEGRYILHVWGRDRKTKCEVCGREGQKQKGHYYNTMKEYRSGKTLQPGVSLTCLEWLEDGVSTPLDKYDW